MPRRRVSRLALTLLAAATVAASAPAAQAAPTRAERTLLAAINDARVANGRARVRFGTTLQTGAHRWALYLFRNDAFHHGSLAPGSSENLAWLTCRRGWARTTVRMWLRSPGHRANLLARGVTRAGIGVASGSWRHYGCVRIAVSRFR